MAWSVVFDVMPATLLPLNVKVPSRRISPPFLSSTVGGSITYSLAHVAVQVGYPWSRWCLYLTRL